LNGFLSSAGVDNINLFKLLAYCQKSMISRKLLGFVERYNPSIKLEIAAEEKPKEKRQSSLLQFVQSLKPGSQPAKSEVTANKAVDNNENVTSTSSFMMVEEFLRCLTNADDNGRIVIQKNEVLSSSSLKFLLLNPAVYFQQVVSEARAVVVAGGTMQPIAEFKDQLFMSCGVDAQRIEHFSCGHVIPAENLLPIVACQGPTGHELDFSYQTRDAKSLLDELGRFLLNLCNIVPGGVVCFFPSYEYEKSVYGHLESTGTIAKISAKKKIFREPRKSSQVDAILGEYSRCIAQCSRSGSGSQLTGALLMSVVGGKMSEGINFSDDLGRCVVMVGLPYPNLKSAELKEKMDYLNRTTKPGSGGRQAGQVHYENLCMKAVNQSIGRAIRHRGDYATIVLLDHRYSRTTVRSALPTWISEHLQIHSKFGPAFSAVRKFFAEKRELKT